MNKIQLLIPMSGQGTRYQAAGFTQPKPAIPVNGTPMIMRLLDNFPESWPCTFVLAENHMQSALPKLLQEIRPTANQLFVGAHKEGPAIAIREGLASMRDEDPVLVSYCDYGMVWDARQFTQFVKDSECDACLISYRGFHAHYLSQVNYAFSRLENERVVEVREKGNFTANRENEFASCGAYYFKSAKLLKQCIDYQIENQIKVNGEMYTSLTISALLRIFPDASVRVFEISGFFQWGTPQDLWDFEYWENTYAALNKSAGCAKKFENKVDQILIPMAGLGSRFEVLTKERKPLIPLQGTPMFRRAIESLPQATKTIGLVYTNEIAKAMNLHVKGPDLFNSHGPSLRTLILERTPAGQALSVEAGLDLLAEDQEILVSACDHGIVIHPAKWQDFRKLNCDAAVFGITGFPGVMRRPKAYSYICLDESADADKCEQTTSSLFEKVKSISVKQPISEPANRASLLVGTFWFRSVALLRQGINDLKKHGQTVNNELYLDGIFDHLLARGLDVRHFPLDGYMNWGDPESLKEALYWQEIFLGHRLAPRFGFEGVDL